MINYDDRKLFLLNITTMVVIYVLTDHTCLCNFNPNYHIFLNYLNIIFLNSFSKNQCCQGIWFAMLNIRVQVHVT